MTPEQIERMRTALKHSKEKLELYRAAHGGEYVGGMEYTRLIAEIDKLLTDSEPPHVHTGGVVTFDQTVKATISEHHKGESVLPRNRKRWPNFSDKGD